MTNEEAINIIEDVTWQDNGRHYGKIAPAREIAISALEKQIPKKPIDDRYPWCICPACGGSVYLEKVQEHIQNNETIYCEHCGQALLWESEVNAE